MELVLLAVIGAALFVADRYINFMADQAAGSAFEQIHEVIDNVSYFGQFSKPIHKQHVCHVIVPFCPSINHDFKVLSLTDCGHWFWFSVTIRALKLEGVKVEPISAEDAQKALKDYPEKQAQLFPEQQPEQQEEPIDQHKKSA